MGGIFGGGAKVPAPQPDPELERMKAERAAQSEKEKKDLEAKNLAEEEARSRGLRGTASLLSGNYGSYGSTLGAG